MYKVIKIILLLSFILTTPLKSVNADDKIKIGLLVPLTGKNSEIGQSIVNSTRLAINKIDNTSFEIIPMDTGSNANITLMSAKKLSELGIKIIIGPIFNDNLKVLNNFKDVIFLSLTNKSNSYSNNIINTGINATSQIRAIKKFTELNKIKKTIFLTPNVDYKDEIENAIYNTKIKIIKNYIYDTDPTKLTQQIEKITGYKVRKHNLEDEIVR